MRRNKKKIVIGVVTIIAALNLAVIFLKPDIILKITGLYKEEKVIPDNAEEGKGDASINVEHTEVVFNGKGIFDPMDGVSATDIDGTDITDKVAVSYVSGEVVNKKKVRYVVFDSACESLEAECSLVLDGYKGPSLKVGEVRKVSFDDLETLPQILIKEEILSGTDGFGSDISSSISYGYELDETTGQAKLTFSLTNSFQDFVSKKIDVIVTDIPADFNGGM